MTDSTHDDSLDNIYSLKFFLFFLFMIFFVSCSLNAPRDNPLDPNLGGNIWGRVLSRNSYGIEGVEISIPNANAITYTDTCGDFGLYVLPEDSMWVFFTHSNYSPESIVMIPEQGVVDTVIVELNGLPFFTSCDVTTHYYDRNLPAEPLYFCQFSTIAGDFDGELDIDSVWVEIPALPYFQRLSYDPDEQEFTHTLYADDLPGQNLESMVGKDIFFNVTDKESTVVQSTPYYVSRIIHQSPSIIFPAGGLDTMRTDTTFIWHRFNYGFYVQYYGEIVRIISGGPADIVYTFVVLDQTDTTYYVEASLLDNGEYYWTLEIFDSFGNSARSREQRFYKD